jgi:hypothetical protein
MPDVVETAAEQQRQRGTQTRELFDLGGGGLHPDI